MLRLGVALVMLSVALIIGIFLGDAVVAFAAKLLTGLDALPSWLVAGVAGLAQITALTLLRSGSQSPRGPAPGGCCSRSSGSTAQA
jgi:hypothetical protein